MEVFRFQMSLPGHEDCGTILIVYNIPHGIQVRGLARITIPEHPSSCPVHSQHLHPIWGQDSRLEDCGVIETSLHLSE